VQRERTARMIETGLAAIEAGGRGPNAAEQDQLRGAIRNYAEGNFALAIWYADRVQHVLPLAEESTLLGEPGKPDRKVSLREMWQQALAGRLQPD
jgi:hypothetical protein